MDHTYFVQTQKNFLSHSSI